jgi:uncharacterized protein YdhG (YjbR/CyaY superfamily)
MARQGREREGGGAPLSGRRRSGDAVFTEEEQAALREYVQERRETARRGAGAEADREDEVLEKIAAMPAADRLLAERIHALVKDAVPGATCRLWYGQPAYAVDGRLICFFQPAHKFKTRYATLGFTDKARLDEGALWPTAFAVTRLDAEDAARVAALLRRAVGETP